jgi:muramoyltetrapeptide carboxypeptidase
MELLANKLRHGACIGLVSPSTPVEEIVTRQYTNGILQLQKFGFEIIKGKFTHSQSWGYTASPQEKAQDINNLFANKKVDAIMCTQGGSTANACLPYLDWNIIRRNPKIFIGISDITVLLNGIHAQTGLITFHGADVMWGFGNEPTAYDLDEFKSMLIEGRMESIPLQQGAECIRQGKASGKLLGGNINCLLKLAGTPYFPDLSNAILAIEAIDVPDASFDHMFHQLKQMGVFTRINGIITGFIDGTDNKKDKNFSMEEILLRIVKEVDFPILKTNNFGHNCPNTTLPIGAMVEMDAGQKILQPLQKYLM